MIAITPQSEILRKTTEDMFRPFSKKPLGFNGLTDVGPDRQFSIAKESALLCVSLSGKYSFFNLSTVCRCT